jgi:hypothetical protein
MLCPGKRPVRRDPSATRLAADKLFGLWITRSPARSADLLEVAQRPDELLNQPEIRSQPPEYQDQQQGNQRDNYQILQITFSTV